MSVAPPPADDQVPGDVEPTLPTHAQVAAPGPGLGRKLDSFRAWFRASARNTGISLAALVGVVVSVVVLIAVATGSGAPTQSKYPPVNASSIGTAVENAYYFANQAGCEEIGSSCNGSTITGSDCQPAGATGGDKAWICGVFSTVGNTDHDIVFDYNVSAKKDACWTAVEIEDPDSYEDLGRLSGCLRWATKD